MTVSRRDAIRISGGTLAGLSLGAKLSSEELAAAQAAPQSQEWPETLVETEMRAGFPVDLPLNADGSAPVHPESAAGPIEGRLMWRTGDARHLPASTTTDRCASASTRAASRG